MGEAPLMPMIFWKLTRASRMTMKGGYVISGYASGSPHSDRSLCETSQEWRLCLYNGD
jgi:hypothetical protein